MDAPSQVQMVDNNEIYIGERVASMTEMYLAICFGVIVWSSV